GHDTDAQLELTLTDQSVFRAYCSHLRGRARRGYRLQRRDLQREPDGARGDNHECDEVNRRGPGQSQECGNVVLPWAFRPELNRPGWCCLALPRYLATGAESQTSNSGLVTVLGGVPGSSARPSRTEPAARPSAAGTAARP